MRSDVILFVVLDNFTGCRVVMIFSLVTRVNCSRYMGWDVY